MPIFSRLRHAHANCFLRRGLLAAGYAAIAQNILAGEWIKLAKRRNRYAAYSRSTRFLLAPYCRPTRILLQSCFAKPKKTRRKPGIRKRRKNARPDLRDVLQSEMFSFRREDFAKPFSTRGVEQSRLHPLRLRRFPRRGRHYRLAKLPLLRRTRRLLIVVFRSAKVRLLSRSERRHSATPKGSQSCMPPLPKLEPPDKLRCGRKRREETVETDRRNDNRGSPVALGVCPGVEALQPLLRDCGRPSNCSPRPRQNRGQPVSSGQRRFGLDENTRQSIDALWADAG